MKLSEAIRIGASMSPQIKGSVKRSDGTCGLGAAYEGTFGEIKAYKSFHEIIQGLDKIYPKIDSVEFLVPHPIQLKINTISAIIVSLNDSYDWSREQIADWVEKIENENGFTGTETPKEKEINLQRKQEKCIA